MSLSPVQAVFQAGGAGAPALMDCVEARMAEVAEGHGLPLSRWAGDTIAAGGKRVRPLLVGLCAGVPVPHDGGVVAAAVAVELIHAATLVHDDVLDRSDLRRGRPTVFAQAGPAAAVATGDLLFSRAFAELAAAGRVDSVRALASACADLAAGELMQRADAYDVGVTVERYLERCRLKTGVLFGAACQLGALAGGAVSSGLGAVYGLFVGLGKPSSTTLARWT